MESKTNLNNNQPKAIILAYNAEFTLKSLGATLIQEDIEINDYSFDSIWVIELTPGITYKAVQLLLYDFLKYYRENDFMDDDTYYDYLPDAIHQVLMLAVQESHTAFEYAKNAISTDEYLTEINHLDDPSFELEDYDYYMEFVNAAQKVL